jgi:hypothetical protein
LTIFGGAVVSRSIFENRVEHRYAESNQAFWLAEAGINCALKELKINYNGASLSTNCTASVSFSQNQTGRYSVNLTPEGQYKLITAHGFIPSTNPARVERVVEALMVKYENVPSGFYGNALYSAGGVYISGEAYDVQGNVTYAGNFTGGQDKINGTIEHNSSITPLAQLNFDQIRAISQGQSNYHNSTQLSGPFPTSFWYNQTAGIPNVIFLDGNLDLTGHTHVAGFFVVGGEVTYNATIGGNVDVDGSIYAPGRFTINGGGNALNVDGGAWSGQMTTLDGHAKVDYNQTVMLAIQNMSFGTDVQFVSWRDTQNPYNLTE